MPDEETWVLIADSSAAGGALVEVVSHAGGRPLLVARFEEILVKMARLHVACAIINVDGPGEGGLGLLKALLTQHPGTDVLVTSAASDDLRILEAIRFGARDFLAMPIQPEVAQNRVRGILERQRLRGEHARAGQVLLQINAYRELLEAISTAGGLPSVASLAASWAARLLDADGASVTRVVGADRREFEYIAAVGSATGLLGRRQAVDDAFTGAVIRQRAPSVFNPESASAASQERAKRDGIRSGVVVPILVGEKADGTIGVISSRPHAFSSQQVQILFSLADYVALAVAFVHATDLRTRFAQIVVMALEEDRRRIARELHDETGQSLTAVLVGLNMLESATLDAAARERLMHLRTLVSVSIEEVSRIAHGLRSPVLRNTDFEYAVRTYASEFQNLHRTIVEVQVNGVARSPLPAGAALMLYRIIQEALTNVAKHAKATTVSIVLHWKPSSLSLIVEDNGVGFTLGPSYPRPRGGPAGLGLHNIRERVVLLHGTFTIESAPLRGTALFIEIPLTDIHGPKNEAVIMS